MSFTEQELSEGIRTNHEFSDNKRRLKRPRDSRDASQQGVGGIYVERTTGVRRFSTLKTIRSLRSLLAEMPFSPGLEPYMAQQKFKDRFW